MYSRKCTNISILLLYSENLVNLTTNGPQKSDCVYGVAMLTGFIKKLNDRLSFCSGQNKVTVIATDRISILSDHGVNSFLLYVLSTLSFSNRIIWKDGNN